MRKLQNIISTFGTMFARQGKQLVVRVEVLRSRCAPSSYSPIPKNVARNLAGNLAMSSSALGLALGLRNDFWQGLCMTWLPCVVVPVVVKPSCRRHLMRHRIIGRHRTAA